MEGNDKYLEKSIRKQYEFSNRRKYLILIFSIAIMIFLGFYFVTIGIADTSVKQVIKAIISWFTGSLNSGDSRENAAYKIIVLMRFPRIVMAIFAGAGLAVSGVAMQSITRNPLVSPFTIGISSASAFGASMCIVFGTGMFFKSEIGIVTCAFLSAIFCAVIVYAVAGKVGMGPESIILIGIALNYLFSALTSTIEFFAQEHKLAAVVQWTFGSFNGTTWDEVVVVMIFVTAGVFIICRFALMLNVMSSGEDELVRSLGINPQFLRSIMGILSVLMTASIISFTGVIGFVGLVAPHIVRIIVGNDHRFLIPFSAVTGSLLLMISDIIGKVVLSPVSIPVGIVVSFLGVPLFINLILNKRKGAL